MSDGLPRPLQHYFSGRNARDLDTALSGFAPDAVVEDERRRHTGPDAIRAWMEESIAQYDDMARVQSVAAMGHQIDVRAEVSGTFTGSPIVLRFTFTVTDDRIVRLKIGS